MHDDPAHALVDGPQALLPENFQELVDTENLTVLEKAKSGTGGFVYEPGKDGVSAVILTDENGDWHTLRQASDGQEKPQLDHPLPRLTGATQGRLPTLEVESTGGL